jgi:hypothetical protein
MSTLARCVFFSLVVEMFPGHDEVNKVPNYPWRCCRDPGDQPVLLFLCCNLERVITMFISDMPRPLALEGRDNYGVAR